MSFGFDDGALNHKVPTNIGPQDDLHRSGISAPLSVSLSAGRRLDE